MIPDLCARPSEPGLVAELLADTDCQAFGLVERGYAALSSPGGSAALLLTSLMVIAVALYGYRLLLGRGLILSEAISLTMKLGVVLLIAASWSTWQSMAYDTLARAPPALANELIVAIDAPGPLAGVQSALDRFEAANVGWRTRAGIASPLVGGAPTAAMALNTSAFLLTISTVGLLVVSRIVLALLLAIAPLMAGLLLFDATRGLLEGWLRALVGAALIPLSVLTLSAIELSILEPMIDRMLQDQAADVFEVSSVTPVALVVIIFSLAMFASVRAVRTIARGVRLSATAKSSQLVVPHVLPATAPAESRPDVSTTATLPVLRALEVAARRDSDAAATRIVAAAMRDSRAHPAPMAAGQAAVPAMSMTEVPAAPHPPPTNTRQFLPRASRAASRRDR